jgi:hypothetical protein
MCSDRSERYIKMSHYQTLPVASATVSRVFCSTLRALGEPVIGRRPAGRLIERTRQAR